ncbi:hypothetical protein ACH5RR_016021 [Cinchona calisaya]|uniref:MULE transposase domain-containing protein n=1 Tax=Cinchona calisaya TaxID=153742 RepID=A0ABD2ZYF2_9GENT
MQLLEIIEITSLNTSVYSCFVFSRKQGYENYEWALGAFRKILGQDSQQSVIVTDRELALMKAIKVVFPKASNVLCVWHIKKNIFANCKAHFKHKEYWDAFLIDWNSLVYSSTEEVFEKAWHEIQLSYKINGAILSYIQRTWLLYKEYFVNAWTEKILNFRNRVTLRAEDAHSKLKKYLIVPIGDIRTVKQKMCIVLENDIHEMKGRMLIEKNKWYFYDNYGFILCTYDECLEKKKALPLESIHFQWRIDIRASLFTKDGANNAEYSLEDILTDLQERYQQRPLAEKEYAQEKLSQLVNGSTSLSFEPTIQCGKRRPPSSRKRKH